MSFLSKIFSNENDEEFDEICVDQEILDAVIYYSKQSFPNEFSIISFTIVSTI